MAPSVHASHHMHQSYLCNLTWRGDLSSNSMQADNVAASKPVHTLITLQVCTSLFHIRPSCTGIQRTSFVALHIIIP